MPSSHLNCSSNHLCLLLSSAQMFMHFSHPSGRSLIAKLQICRLRHFLWLLVGKVIYQPVVCLVFFFKPILCFWMFYCIFRYVLFGQI